jgi:NADH-quinone oxidoreductase subunit H
MDTIEIIVMLAKCVFAVVFVMNIVPLLIYGERKGAAYIQDRPGPNRAHIMGIRAGGLIHTIVDVVKLITKEDITPDHVEKKFWAAAPVIAMTVALSTFVVIPWGDHLTISKSLVVGLQVADINGGLLYILAITSLGVYGIMLAGWSSNNKFSLIGGLRSSAQMVSYELAMGLSLVVMFMLYGSVRLSEIVAQQAGPIWNWGVFQGGVVTGMLAFILFWVAAFAETNRMPFDLPEGEAELVAGYHTEYSSLRFALFFMAEYANMVVASAVTATLFFGGYNVPFLDGGQLREHANTVLMVLGGGGAVVLPVFALMAFRRRKRVFYQALPAGDPRHREPYFWVVVWMGMAAAHAGLAFLGSIGFIEAGTLGPEIVAFIIHLNMLVLKVLIGCWIMIWVRWTIPRFRYDQLMDLGWKRMLPIAVVNVMLAGVWIAMTGGPNG